MNLSFMSVDCGMLLSFVNQDQRMCVKYGFAAPRWERDGPLLESAARLIGRADCESAPRPPTLSALALDQACESRDWTKI